MAPTLSGATFNYFGQNGSELAMRRPKSVRLSVSKAVREQVDGDSLLQEALARDIVNISAVARSLRPALKSRVGKEVSEQAIITSLKRIKGVYGRRTLGYLKVLANSTIDVKTDLAKISVTANAKTASKIRSLAFTSYDSFIQISSSPHAYTLVFEQALYGSVREEFDEGSIMEAKTDLAALILHSPEEIVETPGCVAAIYNQIARAGINIEDTLSNHTDTIIVVSMDDAVRAFTALTNLVSEARREGGQKE